MKKGKKQKIVARIIMPLIFVIGLGIFLYPTISNYLLVRSQTMVVESYQSKVETLPQEKKADIKKKTEEYNRSRVEATPSLGDTFSEKAQETAGNAIDDDGNQVFDVMQALLGESLGMIEIPTIDLKAPIYKGTTEAILQKGIGWLEGSSLPSGGVGTHAVLTGHRGLPTAKLFTDLPEVKKGDQFVITYLDEKLAYEVDQILTVEPEETDALRIEPDKEYVTLITCTPYMVNSHRLLVRGHRVAYDEEKISKARKTSNQNYIYLIIVVVLFLILLLWFIRRRKRRKNERA